MNVTRLAVVSVLLAAGSGACMAASQGVIRFHGSIVEGGCNTAAASGSTVALTGCPVANHGSRLDVREVGSVQALGNATANVKLIADSGDGRYYDQRYVVVDALGKPIQSGTYVITMTSP